MERFERFNNIYRLLAATAVAATSPLILGRLQQIFKERSVTWTVLLALVAIVVFLLDLVLEGSIEKSVTIRKMIAGDEFIEGYWFDISVDRVSNVVHHGSFITIRRENGRFVINGIEFDQAGNRLSTFRSTSAAFENRVLTFGYESHGESFGHAIEIGFDQLQFDNPPQSYSGFYFDVTRTVDFRIQGSRIDQRTIDQHNHFRDTSAKRQFIVNEIGHARKRLAIKATV